VSFCVSKNGLVVILFLAITQQYATRLLSRGNERIRISVSTDASAPNSGAIPGNVCFDPGTLFRHGASGKHFGLFALCFRYVPSRRMAAPDPQYVDSVDGSVMPSRIAGERFVL
jgi:hypothetical protein